MYNDYNDIGGFKIIWRSTWHFCIDRVDSIAMEDRAAHMALEGAFIAQRRVGVEVFLVGVGGWDVFSEDTSSYAWFVI